MTILLEALTLARAQKLSAPDVEDPHQYLPLRVAGRADTVRARDPALALPFTIYASLVHDPSSHHEPCVDHLGGTRGRDRIRVYRIASRLLDSCGVQDARLIHVASREIRRSLHPPRPIATERIPTIWRVALEFPGYDAFGGPEGLSRLFERRYGEFRRTRIWTGTLAELRACLYMFQRRDKWGYNGLDHEDYEASRLLYRTIRSRWSELRLEAESAVRGFRAAVRAVAVSERNSARTPARFRTSTQDEHPGAIVDDVRGPLPASYRLVPGRVTVGEHPTPKSGDLDEARHRLDDLLADGVTALVDLSTPGERASYDDLIARELEPSSSPADVLRFHFPMQPAGAPEVDMVAGALDALDAALASGHRAYVHSPTGIGRTGVVAACHLIRRGLSPTEALSRLRSLWGATEKSLKRPKSPETPTQVEFVRSWPAHERRRATRRRAHPMPLKERYIGAFTGVRRALTLAGGPSEALACLLAVAECLSSQGVLLHEDAATLLRRRSGASPEQALSLLASEEGRCASIAAFVLAGRRDLDWALSSAGEGEWSWEGNAAAEARRWFGAILAGALRGLHRDQLLHSGFEPVRGYWHARPLHPVATRLALGSYKTREWATHPDLLRQDAPPEIADVGAAMWAFHWSDSLEEGCHLLCERRRPGSASAVILFGQLAGAYYRDPRPEPDSAFRAEVEPIASGLLERSAESGAQREHRLVELVSRREADAWLTSAAGDRARALQLYQEAAAVGLATSGVMQPHLDSPWPAPLARRIASRTCQRLQQST